MNRFQSPLIRELWSEKPYNSTLLSHLATLSKGKLNGVPKKIMYPEQCDLLTMVIGTVLTIQTRFCHRRL